MEILLIFFLVFIIGILLWGLYRLLKWICIKKTRVYRTFLFLSILAVGYTVNELFFVKMKFIQSKVYPDLYLIKNPLEEPENLDKAIRKFVSNTVKNNLKKNKQEIDSKKIYSFRFYRYYKSYNPLIFGDAGTSYFIENKEDLSGMIVNDLSHYTNYKLATFNMNNCTKQESYCGVLNYFKEGYSVKNETIYFNDH